MSPQPLKMKAVDTFIRNVGYQEPCSSLWQPTVPESSTSELWKPEISPHIRDVLCANLCPENDCLIEGFRHFSQPFQEIVRIVPQFRPRQFPSTDLSNSLFTDYQNNWRTVIWARNSDEEAISMYKYRNKYVRNLFSAILFAKFITACGVTRPSACLFQFCVLLGFIRMFIIRRIQA